MGAESPPSSSRVIGLDLARSVAILAMVLINFQVYLLRAPSGSAGEVWLRWLAHAPSGRSSAMFVILAGAGIAQMSQRARTTCEASAWWAVRRTLLLRSLFLVVAGNLLIVVWSIDILHHYAAYILFAVFFVRAGPRVLLGSAVLVVIVTAIGAATMPWLEELELPYESPLGMAANVFVSGIHPLFPWFAFVLYGMWLGRQDLGEPSRRRRFLLVAVSLAVSVEVLSLALATLAVRGVLPVPAQSIALLGTSWSPEPLYVLGACSTSTAVVAAAHEVAARAPRNLIVRALISTGQMSLSIYILHALVGVGVPRWVFHLESALGVEVLVLYWAGFMFGVVLMALGLRALVSRGPIETVMRFLTGSGGTQPIPVVALARRLSARALELVRRARGRAALSTPTSVPAPGATISTDGDPPERGSLVVQPRAPGLPGTSIEHEQLAGNSVLGPPTPAPALSPTPTRSPTRSPLAWTFAGLGAAALLVARIFGTAPPTPGCPEPHEVAIGESVASQLTLLCPHVHFTLELVERSGLELETRSGTDVLIEVHREADGELVATDDDSGPGLDARLLTALAPGRYDVLVRPYSATTGPFVLATRAADASGGPPPPPLAAPQERGQPAREPPDPESERSASEPGGGSPS